MADFTLNNGKEINFDLTSLTLREYRALFDRKQPQSEEDAIISRVCGLTVDEYQDLPYAEFKRLLAAFFKKTREPIADPN